MLLRRQRAIEIVPGSKPVRRRRHDVPQHLAPETTNALRVCAVKCDLDLLDGRHRSTIEARPGHRRVGRGLSRERCVAWPQESTDDYLGTRKRRMVTASDRVQSSGSRSILAPPGVE